LCGSAPVEILGITIDPGPPVFAAGTYPVCALVDAEGNDMAIGILRAAEEGSVLVDAPPLARPINQLRLGKMWAAPDGKGGWRLLEQLQPAWRPADG
jgi:hypothetical protein